jgi:hypothetical protein
MPDRRDAERAGIIVCFNFVLRHRKVYRIIPEFEMIDKEVALGYYKKTAQGYVQGLKQAMKKGEIRQFPPQFLAYSLMGMTHFIGLKWIIWTAAISPALISQTLKNNIEFVLWGLAPKK